MEKILSWGKGKLETCEAGKTDWKPITTPKEDTLKISTEEGEEQVAKEEGGGVVARRVNRSTYTLEFDIYEAAGETRPFEDEDGLILGEHQFRFAPENPKAIGFLIERANVSCTEEYSSKEGKIIHYVAKCLRPETGKTLKPYTAG